MANQMPSVDAYHDAKLNKGKVGYVKSDGAPSLVPGPTKFALTPGGGGNTPMDAITS